MREPEAKSFICTTSGVCKYKADAQGITQILRRSLEKIQRPLETVQTPPSPPRHDHATEAAALAGPATPAVAATAVTTTAAAAFAATTTAAAAAAIAPTFVVKTFAFHSRDEVKHKYHLYISTGFKEKVVVYLPGTILEPPNNQPNNSKQVPRWWTGEEMVFAPEIEGQGGTPWRNEMPTWIPEWVHFLQSQAPKETQWSLMGFSRGASWGVSLLSQPDVTFHKVLLVAPYMLPRWSEAHKAQILRALGASGLRARLVWGERDHWRADCLRLLHEVSRSCDVRCAQQCDHEQSLNFVYSQGWWAWLIA